MSVCQRDSPTKIHVCLLYTNLLHLTIAVLSRFCTTSTTSSRNLQNPENALTEQTVSEIAQALRIMELDGSVRAVVLRGTKDFTKKPAFSAGADLAAAFHKELKPNIPMHMSIAMRVRHRDYDELEQFSKPLIAAVDGFALGGGCELVLACDIVIVSDRSRLGLPEINRGILPANGGVTRMAERIGYSSLCFVYDYK